MDLQLTGKRALVTGSSSGIGAGIAEELAREGVLVVVHGRNAERANAVAAKITAAGGQAKVAVTPENLVATYEANTVAAFRLIQALAPAMKERGWGRIINISTAAAITPTSAQPDYGPAKAAMVNMSLGLSKTLRMTGVTVNCVSPGMIRTEGLMEFLGNFAQKRGWGDDIPKAEEYFVNGTGQTVGRVGEVSDIAYAVTMLASPRSDIINGTNLHVDAGISPAIN